MEVANNCAGYVKNVTWVDMSTVYVEFSEEALMHDWQVGVTFVFNMIFDQGGGFRYPLTTQSKQYIDEQNMYLGLDSMASIKGCSYFNKDPKYPNCLRIDLNAPGFPNMLEVRFYSNFMAGFPIVPNATAVFFERK
ncbi:hypothetical protein [Pseudomonas sp. 5P_3.1_Bac2]|uniref:hypothetical protein n=1 Tax=Pseudomonas sp. 5P_3.1_Bac2 TaxID=2971617 RepID=UPI0021C57329|nr:hypothetical protein [Pseudomonas sp. 5P_3.1_Bac2]MCU1715742.1 hypothetical protein [Pseudomonas sp. 5P_3.1_Bac2]